MKLSKNRHKKRWSWTHRRRWCVWAGLAAVLFQVMIPLGQGVSAAAFGQNPDGNVLPLVVCSAMGGGGQISAEGPLNTSPASSAPCAFCFVCQIRGLDMGSPPLASGDVLRSKLVLWVYPKTFGTILKQGWTSVHTRPRAPPSFL